MTNQKEHSIAPQENDAPQLDRYGFREVNLIGHQFKTSDEIGFNSLIAKAVRDQSRPPLCLAHHNLNSLALCLKNKEFKSYYDFVEHAWLDGMSVVLMLRLLRQDIPFSWRLTFLDWQNSFWNLADKGHWRVFILATTDDLVNQAMKSLRQDYPNVEIRGHQGYLDVRTNAGVVSAINSFNPNVLLLGMGMPTQEIWIHRNAAKLNVDVILPLGGYFDYIADATYTPPRWSGRIGLEWLFRLIANPKKLFRRYMVEPWPVLWTLLRYLSKIS